MRADAKKNYDQLLSVAREIVARDGAGASMRDVARQAGVGFGTMYRHFPTREALLEALLRNGFDAMTARANELEASSEPAEALLIWLRETVAAAHAYSGVTAPLGTYSCVRLRRHGEYLLDDELGPLLGHEMPAARQRVRLDIVGDHRDHLAYLIAKPLLSAERDDRYGDLGVH
jgi:AcrR family transcriptional regulator